MEDDIKDEVVAQGDVLNTGAIYTVRTTASRERQVAETLMIVATRRETGVYSIINPHNVKGYIFVEGSSRDEIAQAVYGIHHAKGVIDKPLKLKDVEHFLGEESVEITVKKGDIVELVSGPFRGEKARVSRINKVKQEAVVELLEAAVKIPVTVKTDALRVIQKEEGEEKKTLKEKKEEGSDFAEDNDEFEEAF